MSVSSAHTLCDRAGELSPSHRQLPVVHGANESLLFTPEDNRLELQEEVVPEHLCPEELFPHATSILLPYGETRHLGPRYGGGDYGTETWTVLNTP